jgi:hypothetical protein
MLSEAGARVIPRRNGRRERRAREIVGAGASTMTAAMKMGKDQRVQRLRKRCLTRAEPFAPDVGLEALGSRGAQLRKATR